MKIIKVKDETHDKLMEYGKKKETFDEIINRLLELTKKGGKLK